MRIKISIGVVRTSLRSCSSLAASGFPDFFASSINLPFTTLDLIHHLLDCFQYLGGIPEELVIDQDKVMVSSENRGDIIYTRDFKQFIEEMDLKMYVCRKNDPESKGKIENLIKFIKRNFLSIRDFENIEEAKERLSRWLNRRANGKISLATRRIPKEMFSEEKAYLRTLKNSIYRKDSSNVRERRKADRMGLDCTPPTRHI